MGLYLVVLVFRISVSQSGINKIIHEGWEKPLVNKSFAPKGESGRWFMKGSDGWWKGNPKSTIAEKGIVTMDTYPTSTVVLLRQ